MSTLYSYNTLTKTFQEYRIVGVIPWNQWREMIITSEGIRFERYKGHLTWIEGSLVIGVSEGEFLAEVIQYEKSSC